MAKANKKTNAQPNPQSQPAAPVKSGTRDDAIRAICCVTGCGIVTAVHKLAAMPVAKAQSIADAEANGQRSLVPQILLTTTQDSTDDQSPDSDLHSGSEGADGGSGPST